MNDDKDVFIGITDDKEFIKEIIFGGTEEKAIEMCKLIRQYNVYDGWSGFGKYLAEARRDDPIKARKLANELSNKLTLTFDGNKEETHHVWIVLQEVMKWLAGEASKEFMEKVEKNE